MSKQARSSRGFTLIELMITVGVVAIIASIAYPSYASYSRRAKRTDATAALLRVAVAQEKFYVQNNTYTGTLGTGGLNITGTERGYYTLDFPAAPTAAGFTVRATATGPQVDDKDCRVFTLNQAGVKTAADSAGAANSVNCWR